MQYRLHFRFLRIYSIQLLVHDPIDSMGSPRPVHEDDGILQAYTFIPRVRHYLCRYYFGVQYERFIEGRARSRDMPSDEICWIFLLR